MNLIRTTAVLLAALAAARGDVLCLRDGRTVVGYYTGGTDKEIWFQSNPLGADCYPTFLVESVKFGPMEVPPPHQGASAPHGKTSPAPGLAYLAAGLATAWLAAGRHAGLLASAFAASLKTFFSLAHGRT